MTTIDKTRMGTTVQSRINELTQHLTKTAGVGMYDTVLSYLDDKVSDKVIGKITWIIPTTNEYGLKDICNIIKLIVSLINDPEVSFSIYTSGYAAMGWMDYKRRWVDIYDNTVQECADVIGFTFDEVNEAINTIVDNEWR